MCLQKLFLVLIFLISVSPSYSSDDEEEYPSNPTQQMKIIKITNQSSIEVFKTHDTGESFQEININANDQEDLKIIFVDKKIKGNTDNDQYWSRYFSALKQIKKLEEVNTQSNSEKVYTWDDAAEEIMKINRAFFKEYNRPISKKVRFGQVVGGFFGLFPEQANIPIVWVSMRRVLGIESGESIAPWIIGAWLTGTTTPVYVQQLGNRGGEVMHFLFEEDALEDFRFKHSIGHKLLNLLAALSSGLNASIRVAYLFALEDKQYLPYSIVVGGPLALAEFERRFTIGSANIDRVFYQYYASARSNLLKRSILMDGIDLFIKKITIDDLFAKNIYTLLAQKLHAPQNHEKKGLLRAEKEDTLEISGLFLKHLMCGEDQYMTFISSLDSVVTPPVSQSGRTFFGDVILGLSTYANYRVLNYALNHLILSKWTSNQKGVEIASEVLAVSGSVSRACLEYDSLKSYFKNLGNFFRLNHVTDHKITRKIVCGVAGFINAGLHLFTNVQIGMDAFASDDLPTKIMNLLSVAVMDGVYYDSYFNGQLNDLLTNFFMRSQEVTEISIENKKNILKYFALRLKKEIPRLETEYIENLYAVIYDNLGSKK